MSNILHSTCNVCFLYCGCVQNHANMRVLIAGTENITSMLYFGQQRSMLLTNCL